MQDRFGKNIAEISNKKLFLFDMDGTIYEENRLFDGVVELLDLIKKQGGRYVFITNNSSKSVTDYVKKLRKMGIPATAEDFFTSTQACALVLRERFGGELLYVQGTKSFVKEIKKSGYKVTTKYTTQAKAILVGFDTEITGKKMRVTCEMLGQDLPYFAANPDWVCPVSFGFIPDCGSMCQGYERATGKKPVFIGKPEPTMVLEVMKKFGYKAEETMVTGDRLYTDIASGVNAGVDTVCVLSGEVKFHEVEESDVKPTYTLDSVKDILEQLKQC